MAQLGVMIEAQEGLTWERWAALIDAADRLGYTWLRRSDHLFSTIAAEAREGLALWPTLTMVALRSARLRFGQMVSPITWRHPVLLARHAAALDRLSGGRLDLGIGAGWNEAEHRAFGIPFPPTRERFDRLEEAIQVIQLLHTGERVRFAGRYYQLDDAICRPTPARPGGVRLVVGGKGRQRTLRLAAAYADEWNVTAMAPTEYEALRDTLERYCAEAQRDPRSITRTIMLAHLVGRDEAELRERARRMQQIIPALRDIPTDAVPDRLRERGWLVGTPDEVVERIQAWEAVGMQGFLLQTLDQEDIAALELIAWEVMPRVMPAPASGA
ncbi:MAG: TIGR03560 family F420-dependent LLM class oxidoreductase [Sphaerobacter sp.]|nr:TIGR03560 family F420-dependent LLM class oxidoreductase [Sphaerobacter sp.]